MCVLRKSKNLVEEVYSIGVGPRANQQSKTNQYKYIFLIFRELP
jgi:hypothetical protein